MKLILEKWKSFLAENKKKEIADLKFGALESEKHKKKISKEPKVIDIKLSDIPISKFPSNNSAAVKRELKQVLDSMVDNNEMTAKEIEEADKNPEKLFIEYLNDNDLDFDENLIDNIYEDVSIITLRLKMRYNRPRPEQLGHLVGYDIRSIKTDTDNTPSFPSGHTTQAWTVAYYLSSKHPDHKKELFEIAEKIEKSRIIRGAHYPSDNREARKIAEKYLFPNIEEKKE